jgi:hypothetical protein
MKAIVYMELHIFSSAFEQAWDATQKLHPQPWTHLPVHILQILELPQRPEALPEIADGAFHLAVLTAAGWIAGTREEVVTASEAQESREETNQAPSCSATAVARLS